MAHLQYMPGDPRLVDQLVYELKSKGIFDQFRKDCIADVDTRPAYQNLRQRVENSVTTFLSRQTWQPDMNKNQLREKLRKHILDGNYLEQGVERIVDQVVNPKVASVFIPKVEDLVYQVLGITRKKSPSAETSHEKVEDLLPNDLEAVSPGSVKSDVEKNETMDVDGTQDDKMDIDEEKFKLEAKEDTNIFDSENENIRDIQLPSNRQNDDADKSNIPLPSEEIKPENIPSPEASPPKTELEKIELPKDIISKATPINIRKEDKDQYFKPVISEDDDSSSGSSLRRNMSPLTPIRNYNNENSCDAQQAFENDSTDNKSEDKKEPSSFRFKIDAKTAENSLDAVKAEKKETETLSYQFNNQVNINNHNTPLYEESSNSNNLHIDYESDVNSKANIEIKVPENDHNSEDSRKEKKAEEKKSSHKSSHRSRDSPKHSSSKDKRSESKHCNSRDSSRHDKSKSSKDDNKSKSTDKEKSKDKNEKKDSSRESSRHRSSHKSSHKDSKSHRSSSSSGRHSSKHSDEKKISSSSSSHRDKDKNSDKSSSEKSKDSKSSSHKSDKDRKSSSSIRNDKNSSKSKDEKEKDKKSKKENDDHYSLSGRGNPNRRSTDRDSNDGSTSSKGSHNPSSSKSSNSKKDSKSSSKSESTSTSGESTSPSDKENIVQEQHSSKTREALQHKPIVRIERRLEVTLASPPRLPFVPDVTIRKPKFAANLEEAKRLMKMRKFLDEEQKRMNQEAALLLEFQANVRPSMSQVYSNIPGPELEFACVSNVGHSQEMVVQSNDNINQGVPEGHDIITMLKHEHDNINNVLPEEDNNVNNTVTQEHDKNVLTIEKAHYTNNELLTVLNDTKDDEANVVKSYEKEIDIDNIDNDIKSDDIVLETIKISENNQQIEIDATTSVEFLEDIGNNSVQSNGNIISDVGESLGTIKNNEKEVTNEPTEAIEQMESTEIATRMLTTDNEKPQKEDNKKTHSNLFEVTIITEELSESEETHNDVADRKVDNDTQNQIINDTNQTQKEESKINGEYKLHYFGEHEKYNAELEKAQFNNFFKEYNTKNALSNKLYLINCDSYEENIVREVSKDLGDFEIISYHKNGHLTLPKNKNVIKNVNISKEISLPLETDYESTFYDANEPTHNVFSPEKSECSFELSSDYDSKLEEMVNKTSRQEILEIILGNVIDSSPSKMPRIDYVTESKIDSDYENNLKRKICEISEETTANVNNNRPVLTPNKIRKLSTDQITSTTQENEETLNIKTQITRSKYLGRARRVGLPRPKRTALSNSPSSDKSVENYEENTLATPTTPTTPNGKLRRSKVQRYDTSDLYKPKLHYLSRRNHVT